jgi:small subunit ribosomal protein S8
MAMSDPLGDMLTRIRNGQHARHKVTRCPASKLRRNVLEVLRNEGFIRDYREQANDRGLGELHIELKYDDGQPVIRDMRRVSRPGRRVYSGVRDMPSYYSGLGVTVVSTPHGVMADHIARNENVGGEVLCQVF